MQQVVLMVDLSLSLTRSELSCLCPVLTEAIDHIHLAEIRFLDFIGDVSALDPHNLLPVVEEVVLHGIHLHEAIRLRLHGNKINSRNSNS